MSETLNLFEQQARNRRQTAILMVVFVLFFAWLGFGGDLVLYLQSRDYYGQAHYTVPWLGIVVTAIGALVAWNSWVRGPKRVLWSVGGREIVTPETHEERQFVNVVEEMAVAAGLPRPKTYVVDDPDPNAFATGHGPHDASIAVTSGLLTSLNREELQGVVGHEMAHVRNLDVRLMTMVAAMVGVIVILSDVMGRFFGRGGGRMIAGGGGGGSRMFSGGGRGGGRRGGGGGALVLVILVLWLISLILAPLVARLMAMAISRNREYLADASAAELTRNPGALASALEKIESSAGPTKAMKRGTAHLCIADPLGRKVNAKEGRMADLFGTHPPMTKRLTILKGMAFQQAKSAAAQA